MHTWPPQALDLVDGGLPCFAEWLRRIGESNQFLTIVVMLCYKYYAAIFGTTNASLFVIAGKIKTSKMKVFLLLLAILVATAVKG